MYGHKPITKSPSIERLFVKDFVAVALHPVPQGVYPVGCGVLWLLPYTLYRKGCTLSAVGCCGCCLTPCTARGVPCRLWGAVAVALHPVPQGVYPVGCGVLWLLPYTLYRKGCTLSAVGCCGCCPCGLAVSVQKKERDSVNCPPLFVLLISQSVLYLFFRLQ